MTDSCVTYARCPHLRESGFLSEFSLQLSPDHWSWHNMHASCHVRQSMRSLSTKPRFHWMGSPGFHSWLATDPTERRRQNGAKPDAEWEDRMATPSEDHQIWTLFWSQYIDTSSREQSQTLPDNHLMIHESCDIECSELMWLSLFHGSKTVDTSPNATKWWHSRTVVKLIKDYDRSEHHIPPKLGLTISD